MGLKTVYEDRLGLCSYLYRYAVDHGFLYILSDIPNMSCAPIPLRHL
jgi:hypothetical protein